MVAGTAQGPAPTQSPDFALARFHTDGTLDLSFNPGTGADNWVETISIQSDGKIIIGGYLTIYNGVTVNRIVRLNADGTIDPSFNMGIKANDVIYTTMLQSDGKIFIASESGKVVVLPPGGGLEAMAINDLQDSIYATPALVGNRIYIRTLNALYCFGAKR